MKTLRVKSTNEYLWRVNIAGHAHNWVKCWHVVDETGMMIAGGYTKGSNIQSSNPRFKRKRDAVAYKDGYDDVMKGVVVPEKAPRGLMPPLGCVRAYLERIGHKLDSNAGKEYEAGINYAIDELEERMWRDEQNSQTPQGA